MTEEKKKERLKKLGVPNEFHWKDYGIVGVYSESGDLWYNGEVVGNVFKMTEKEFRALELSLMFYEPVYVDDVDYYEKLLKNTSWEFFV